MFEAIHGTAPPIAGKGIANPSGLLLSGVMMMNYIGQNAVAEKVHNALLKTLEDGIHTGDIANKVTTKRIVGTAEFAQAVIERLGQRPTLLPTVDYSHVKSGTQAVLPAAKKTVNAEFVIEGIDVNVAYNGDPQVLARKAQAQLPSDMKLDKILSARNDEIWPGRTKTFPVDMMTLRILYNNAAGRSEKDKRIRSANLLMNFTQAGGIDWVECRTLTYTKPSAAGLLPVKNYR